MENNNQPTLKSRFSSILLKWNREKNNRAMPWKGEKDPYRIWISEIILQQTRVEQGLNYYNRFINRFPNVHKLAKAPDTEVFKLWEGLGYYSRCRNLIQTAHYISRERKGIFPSTYDEIVSLKGIGPYTAAAISSFAYNLPHAVVDGNVFRVLARIFGIALPTDSTEGKKYFTTLANELLDKKHPGLYNQAIMDFGATICKPKPDCPVCPFRKSCYAFQSQQIENLPVKEKKIRVRDRWFYYLLLQNKNKIGIRLRKEKDVWQNLYEFLLLETKKPVSSKRILFEAEKRNWITKGGYTVEEVSSVYRRQLSHQTIEIIFLKVKTNRKPSGTDLVWVDPKHLDRYAFPRALKLYLAMG